MEKFYLKKDNDTDTYIIKNQENLELIKVSFDKNKINVMFEGLTYNFIMGCIISIILLEELKRQNDINIDEYYSKTNRDVNSNPSSFLPTRHGNSDYC